MNAFDGAGPEYRQPGYRTILVLGLVIVVLIVLIQLAGAWLGDLPDASPSTSRGYERMLALNRVTFAHAD